jgi:hypothetical protein
MRAWSLALLVVVGVALTLPARASAPTVAVFDAHPAGVDARAAGFVSEQIRRSVSELGWTLIPVEQSRALLAQSSGFGGLSPARAAEITRASGARFGVFTKLGASGGHYVVEITVVASDGAPPSSARAQAGQTELAAVTDRLLRSALAAPAAPPPPAPALSLAPPALRGPPPVEPAPATQRFRLALQTEAAFGVATGSFYNHLAGARLDRRFSDEFSLGAYAGYANLKGKQGRAHNWLAYFMLEYRLALSDGWALPFRMAPGYLPNNGPTARLSAGVSLEVADDIELVLEPIAPMLWITGDQAVLSLNVAVEVGFTF